RVLVFDTTTIANGMAAVNVLGEPDFTTTTAATARNRLRRPLGVAYDGVHERLFVADANNTRVLVFKTGTITNGMDAANVIGQSAFPEPGAPSGAANFSTPAAVAYDAPHDRLYVPDAGANRVLEFNTASIVNGMSAEHVLGQPDFISTNTGSTQSTLNLP